MDAKARMDIHRDKRHVIVGLLLNKPKTQSKLDQWRVEYIQHPAHTHTHSDSDVAWLWAAALTRCLSLTVSLYQEGGSLMDSSGALRLPLYTTWLELNQKEVTFDL